MKRMLFLAAILLAFTFTAMAQDASASGASGQTSAKSSKSSKKKSSETAASDTAGGAASQSTSAKSSTLTGCVSSAAGSDGNYMLTNGRYKNGVSLMPTDKIKDHAGHQVALKGSWGSDKKSFNIDSVKHISPTCSAAKGGGTTGTAGSGTKGSKKKSGDATSTPKGF